MMAENDDVIVGIEFLMSPSRDIAHRDVLRTFNLGCLVFPRLANIEQRKALPALPQGLDLAGRNFKVHRCLSNNRFRRARWSRAYRESRAHHAAWSNLIERLTPRERRCRCGRRGPRSEE